MSEPIIGEHQNDAPSNGTRPELKTCHRSIGGQHAECIGQKCTMWDQIPMLITSDKKPVMGCLEMWNQKLAIQHSIQTGQMIQAQIQAAQAQSLIAFDPRSLRAQ